MQYDFLFKKLNLTTDFIQMKTGEKLLQNQKNCEKLEGMSRVYREKVWVDENEK